MSIDNHSHISILVIWNWLLVTLIKIQKQKFHVNLELCCIFPISQYRIHLTNWFYTSLTIPCDMTPVRLTVWSDPQGFLESKVPNNRFYLQVCDSFFWTENMPLHQIISDITKDGVLYAVVLTEASAADKTINIHVLQGKNPKGDIPFFYEI